MEFADEEEGTFQKRKDSSQMDILVFRWGSLSEEDIVEVMESEGARVTQLSWQVTDYENDPALERKFFAVMQGRSFDYVFSFNYLPVLAKLCHTGGVRYVSWIYDSPHLTLYSDTIFYDENKIFHFDRLEAEQLKQRGVKNVFHMPLAVNEKRLEALCENAGCDTKDAEKMPEYRQELCFLGSLYEENAYDQIYSLPEALKGYLDGVLAVQSRIREPFDYQKASGSFGKKRRTFGQKLLLEALDEERMEQITRYVSFSLKKLYPASDDRRVFLDMFLLRKTAQLERMRMLKLLSEHFEDVVIYTGSDTTKLPKVKNKGYADYRREMPRSFAESKINLNLSLRTIRSGIPLRVMDIMGAGGFVLTNDQPELSELFIEGEDYAAFRTEEELFEKADYYLTHEEERKRIAKNGCRKVRSLHTYRKRLEEIRQKLEM